MITFEGFEDDQFPVLRSLNMVFTFSISLNDTLYQYQDISQIFWMNQSITSDEDSPPIKITNYYLGKPWYPVSKSEAEDDIIQLN